ncbi:MAG: LCCL domain-containing protein [Cyanobacteria bacterium J06598_1]
MTNKKLARLLIAISSLATIAVTGSAAVAAPTISWSSNATDLRGQNGQTFSFVCPPSGTIDSVRGSIIYTDDSSVCSAAVHAGKITAASGGEVLLSILPGQPAYPGSNVNGVSSEDAVSGSGSFIFFDTEGFAAQVEEDRVMSIERASRVQDIYVRFDVSDYTHPNQLNQEFTYNCVPDPLLDDYVWGTDVYSGNSSVCLAAVHAGLIPLADGGEITLKIGRAQSSYVGSSRNGISTRDLGRVDVNETVSFTFVR